MKSKWRSKTFWVNLLTLTAGTLGYWAGQDLVQDKGQLMAALIAVQGGVNIVLRFMTTQPIK
jgi:hypothetical protein